MASQLIDRRELARRTSHCNHELRGRHVSFAPVDVVVVCRSNVFSETHHVIPAETGVGAFLPTVRRNKRHMAAWAAFNLSSYFS